MTVIATLNDYPYTSPTSTCQSTITLTVIDPCLSTSISAVQPKVEYMVAFVGFPSASKIKYAYTDTVSIALTLTTDIADFCGDKQLSLLLNGTTSNFLTALNSDHIYFNPPSNTTVFGVGLATVQASMKNYPSIKSSIMSFTATILSSIVPAITNRVYTQSSPLLDIKYDPFKVIPESYDVGPSIVSVYIFSGTAVP